VNRNIQIAIAAILTSTVIIAIGYYSIPFEQEQPKLSYKIDAIVERLEEQENTNEKENMNVFGCEKSYPDLCIPKGEITLTCKNTLERSFNVTHDDPNNLDPDGNGIGCE